MNALMSSRPRRGSCNEYCKSMLGAASSSTMPRLHFSPQKSVNQRPTMALFSLSLDMMIHFLVCDGRRRPDRTRVVGPDPQLGSARGRQNSGSCLGMKGDERDRACLVQ